MPLTAIVMTTVNAPYGEVLKPEEFAMYLVDITQAKKMPGHVSSFFGEVSPELQIAFAKTFGIGITQLKKVAKDFSSYSGQRSVIGVPK